MEVLRAPAGRRTLEAVLSPTGSGGHMAVSVFVSVGDISLPFNTSEPTSESSWLDALSEFSEKPGLPLTKGQHTAGAPKGSAPRL